MYVVQLAGAVLLVVWSILDCVDGNLARYHNKANKHGELIDSIGGYIIPVAMLCALGVGAFVNPDRGQSILNEAFGLESSTSQHALLFLGAWATVMLQTARLTSQNYRRLFGNPYREFTGTSKPGRFIFAFLLFLKSAVGYGLLIPLMFLGVIGEVSSFVVIYYAALGTVGLFYVITVTVIRAQRSSSDTISSPNWTEKEGGSDV